MKNKKGILIICFIFCLLCPILAMAEEKNPVELYFFEGQGCPHCAKMKGYLEGLKADYPSLKVFDFEVYFNQGNQVLYEKMAKGYNVNSGSIPGIFIGEEFINGDNFEKVKNAVEKCSSGPVCPSPMSKVKEDEGGEQAPGKVWDKNTIVGWGVIGAIIVAVGAVVYFSFIKKKKNV